MPRISRMVWIWSGAASLAVALAIQLVPYGRNHANPPVTREPAWDSAATRQLAKRACFDCHSNETEWPAYARIAPASWLVQHDVTEGRGVLNFSEWHRTQEGAKDMSEEVLQREMPPATYRWVHAHARLSATDVERLANGLVRTMGASAAQEHQREQ
jgi:mono/diheme cytochrome c family protein